MTSRLTIFLTLTILLFSCREKGEVRHSQVKKTAPAHPAQLPKATPPPTSSKPPTLTPYQWSLPNGWTAKPASGMRLATIVIPTPGTTLEASVTEFGGELTGNINRWRKQLTLPPLPEKEILNSLEEIQTSLGKGYIIPLTNPASPDNALLAAIIPRPSGTSVFVKITGTTSELKTITAPFRQFVKSFSPHE